MRWLVDRLRRMTPPGIAVRCHRIRIDETPQRVERRAP